MTDRLPHQLIPHSREAEEAVIGAVLINPEAYYTIAQFLQVNDFYIHRHRWIWETFTRLLEQRCPIDILTVTQDLERVGHLAEVGGPAYLIALVNNVPTSLHAESYGRIIEQAAIRRRMLEAANQVAKLAYQEDATLESVIGESEKAIFAAGERLTIRDLRPASAVLSDLYDQIEQRSRQDEIAGIPTGFIDLDSILQGLQPSDFVVVAGRPGMGKTSFLLSVAKTAAQVRKKTTALFTLEMANEQLMQRMIAQETGIDSQRIRTGRMTENEWPLFAHAIEVIGGGRLYLDDTPSLTPMQLRAKCRRLQAERGLDLVIVDYLQLMAGGGRFENRVQEVSYISRQMKALAKEINAPVLAAAQLSRAIEKRADKTPVLSDLRESGGIEQDADVVMFLHRTNETANIVMLNVAKHRNGPVGTVDLIFRSQVTRFESVARGDANAQ